MRNSLLPATAFVLLSALSSAQGPGSTIWTPWNVLPPVQVTSAAPGWESATVVMTLPWWMQIGMDVALAGPVCGQPSSGVLQVEYQVPVGEISLPGRPNRMRILLSYFGGTRAVQWRNVRIDQPQGAILCGWTPPASGPWGSAGPQLSCSTPGLSGENEFEFAFQTPQPAPVITVVDANDPLFRLGFGVRPSPQALSAGGEDRTGTTTDGVSLLLIRVDLGGPGDVRFELRGGGGGPAAPGGDDGILQPPGPALSAQPGAQGCAACFEVAAVQTAAGWQAFAVFRPPRDFVASGASWQASERTRDVGIRVTWFPPWCQPQAISATETATVTLHRPPVILCHGVWSDRDTWGPAFNWEPVYLRLVLAPGEMADVFLADYRVDAASSLARGASYVRVHLVDVLKLRRDHGVACTQVDWVGHSMGGLLARAYFRRTRTGVLAGAGFYERPENFNQGDFHKLITIATPHWGSPWGNALAALRDTAGLGAVVSGAMRSLDMPIDEGAVDDLREGSAALTGLGPTPVPAHAIVGTAGPAIVGYAGATFDVALAFSGLPPMVRRLFTVMASTTDVSTDLLYRGEAHDLIVLESSQRGGLPPAQVTMFSDIGSHHVGETSSAAVAGRVLELLNARLGSGLFAAGFPAPNPAPAATITWPPPGGLAPAVPSGALGVFGPAGATAGQSVILTLLWSQGFEPAKIAVLARGTTEGAFALGAPSQLPFAIPVTVAGMFPLVAIGVSASGATAMSAPLMMTVVPAVPVLYAGPVNAAVRLGRPQARTAIGLRARLVDGAMVDIHGGAGATFASSNPAVATVSPEGIVTAQGEGSAGITVAYPGALIPSSAVVPVVVDFVPVQGWPGATGGAADPVFETFGGAPRLGNQGFGLRIGGLPGPRAGFLAVAARVEALGSGTGILTFPWTETILVPVHAGPAPLEIPVPIANDPALLGLMLFGQSAFVDPQASGGWHISNGLRLTVVP